MSIQNVAFSDVHVYSFHPSMVRKIQTICKIWAPWCLPCLRWCLISVVRLIRLNVHVHFDYPPLSIIVRPFSLFQLDIIRAAVCVRVCVKWWPTTFDVWCPFWSAMIVHIIQPAIMWWCLCAIHDLFISKRDVHVWYLFFFFFFFFLFPADVPPSAKMFHSDRGVIRNDVPPNKTQ